jgi:uncharacterized protein
MMEDNNPKKMSFVEKHNISPVLFGALSLLVVFISYQVIGSVVMYLLVGTEIKSMNPQLIRIVASLGQILFLLFPTFLLAKLLPDSIKETFKLNKISFRLVFFVVISVFALMEIAQILLLLQAQIPLPAPIESAVKELKQAMEETYKILISANGMGELSFVIVVIALVPAICEELLFRGLLQHSFVKGMGAKSGIILTGFLFAIFHFNPFAFIALLVLGIYFSFLAYRTNSIYSSMTAHFTNNFFASISFYYFGKDDIVLENSDTIINAAQLPSLFLIFVVSLGIFIASLYMIFRETSTKNI